MHCMHDQSVSGLIVLRLNAEHRAVSHRPFGDLAQVEDEVAR